MVTRDLRFNIFANDRASSAFAKASAAADRLATRLTGLDGKRVRATVAVDTKGVEEKLARAEAQLEAIDKKRANPRIDADIALAQAKMVRLASDLQKLGKERNQAKIDADVSQAKAKISDLHDRLDALGRGTQTPKISLETFEVRKKITEVQAQLETLGKEKANPEIALRTAEIEAQMTRLRVQIQELGQMKASPKIDADIAAAQAKIAALKAQLGSMGGGRVGFDFKDSDREARSFLGTLDLMRQGLQNNVNAAAQLVRNMRQLALPATIAGFAEVFASLGASIQTAAGAMLLLPGAATFAATAITTLSIGFNDLKRAIGPRDTGTQIKQAEMEMSRLGLEAQKLAHVVIDLKDTWNGLKKEVQNHLFDDLAVTFRSLAEQWIPVLKDGFSGMADGFNTIAKDMNGFLRDAQTVGDVTRLFSMFKMTLNELAPSFANISSAFLDMSVVGASFLPTLAAGFTNATGKFKEFIAQARASGDLSLWIAQGIVTIKEMGTALGNLGSSFGAIFQASRSSGAAFTESLVRMTGEMKAFLQSAQGQAGMIALFQGIRDAVDSLMPGLKAIAGAISDSFVTLQPAVKSVGDAFSAFAIALAPTLNMLAMVAVDIIVPLANAFGFLSQTLGSVMPMILTMAVAFKGLTVVGALLVGMGGAISGFASSVMTAGIAMGVSDRATQGAASATERLGNTLSRVGNSLPLIGAALVGIVAIYDSAKSKAEEYATAVLKGSLTLAQAVAQEKTQIDNRNFWWSTSSDKIAEGARSEVEARQKVIDSIRKQMDSMTPLQRATADVTLLEENYNEQLRLHGENSRDASTAADILKAAKERLTTETLKHTDATRTDTEALIANTQETQNAANADLAFERSNLRLEEQQRRTTQAIKDHGSASIEGRQATLDLRDAYLNAADAAGRKAEADAKARGEADAASQGAVAYRGRLIELASTAEGPVRAALINTIKNLESTKNGSNDAALAAVGLADDVGRIPTAHATNVTTPGLAEARAGIKGLTTEILNIQGKTVSIMVTATGQGGLASAGRLATGGILPGYTPGRDVHRFIGAAGMLELSGGEAVMRPEWTRAMGPQYVDAANAAARQGGIAGVAQFIARTAPRGFQEGVRGDGTALAEGGVLKFANGGVVANVTHKRDMSGFNAQMAALEARAIELGKKAYGGAALSWARTQAGKPYIWGGVGPAGYDCSGFMSAIVNVMRGRPTHSRVGTTANFPWGGFAPGVGPGLSIGSVNGNPGHMAGTLGGVNVESSGGAGVRVGGGARGASDSMFNVRAHSTFDEGGVASGIGWLQKLTTRPERVLNPYQTQSFDRLVGILDTMRSSSPQQIIQSGGGGETTAEVARLRSDMQALGETIRKSLSVSRPITVEDRSGNPVETARATQLALRLG